MKKKLNLIALISQAVSVLLLFMPGVFRQEQWKPMYGGGHALNSNYSKCTNFFVTPTYGASNDIFVINFRFKLSIFTAVLMVLVGILVFLCLLDKIKKYKRQIAFTPCISFAVYIITSILYIMNIDRLSSKTAAEYWLYPNWAFYIIIALQIVTIVCALLAEFKIFENATQTNVNLSNADELKKFKDLLDSGAITQAEFEEKKKQLLNL